MTSRLGLATMGCCQPKRRREAATGSTALSLTLGFAGLRYTRLSATHSTESFCSCIAVHLRARRGSL
jgi:hypothetical protein